MAWDDEFLRFIGVPQQQPPDPMAPERSDEVTPQPPVEPAPDELSEPTLTSDRILQEAIAERGLAPVESIGTEQTVGEVPPPEEVATGLGVVEDPRPWPPPEWLAEAPTPDEVQAEEERPFIGEEPRLGVPELAPPAPPPSPGSTLEDPFEREMLRQSQMTPEERAYDSFRREQERAAQLREDYARLTEERIRAQEEAWEDFQEANQVAQQRTEQVYRQAQQLAQEEIDPNRWWSDRTTAGKIAAFASVGLGGLLAPNYGGRNTALEAIQQQISQDIDVQAANLDHRRAMLGQQQGIVAEMYRLTGDERRARQAAIVASYELTAQQLEAQAQAYDPNGTTVARVMDQIGQMRAQQGDALREYQKEERDFELKARKDQREELKSQIELAKFEDERRARLAGPAAPKAPTGRTVTDPDTGEELPIGHPRVVINPLTGDPLVARNKDAAKRFNTKVANYAAARDAADELAALVDTTNSGARAKGSTRFESQEVADINIVRHKLARALAAFEGETREPGNRDVMDMLESRVPEADVWFGRQDAGTSIRRMTAGMERSIHQAARSAAIDPESVDLQGAPVPGSEEGTQRDMEPTEHRVTRDAIRNTPLEDINRDDAVSLSRPPVGSDPEEALEVLEANLGVIADRVTDAREQRDAAVADGDGERAEKLDGVYKELFRTREQIRMRRAQSAEDVEKRRQRRIPGPPIHGTTL